MAKNLGVSVAECGARIDAYGPSPAEATAHQTELPLLGSLPLDPDLAVMCDQGEAEKCRHEGSENAVDRILRLESGRFPDGVDSQIRPSRRAGC